MSTLTFDTEQYDSIEWPVEQREEDATIMLPIQDQCEGVCFPPSDQELGAIMMATSDIPQHTDAIMIPIQDHRLVS